MQIYVAYIHASGQFKQNGKSVFYVTLVKIYYTVEKKVLFVSSCLSLIHAGAVLWEHNRNSGFTAAHTPIWDSKCSQIGH